MISTTDLLTFDPEHFTIDLDWGSLLCHVDAIAQEPYPFCLLSSPPPGSFYIQEEDVLERISTLENLLRGL